MSDNIRIASYPPQGKEKKAMKLPRTAANCRDLVLINRLYNAINTHLFITRIALRNSL